MKENKVTKFFKAIYEKIFKINDSPQKVSLGFGVGVFAGIFPGTGPVAALFMAMILRANRASALIGALLTNTWLSFVTFILALQIGAWILKVKWQDIYNQSLGFLRDFHWLNLFKVSFLQIILPMLLGYVLIGLALGLLAYITTLILLKTVKYQNKS